MTTGGCLCGAVRYEITGALGAITHCYCGMCRRQHGAAFATYATAERAGVHVLDGQRALAGYRSSARAERQFCRVCGSSLFWSSDDDAEWLDVAVGTFDHEPEKPVDAHIFVRDKPSWVKICDDLPQFPGTRPRV